MAASFQQQIGRHQFFLYCSVYGVRSVLTMSMSIEYYSIQIFFHHLFHTFFFLFHRFHSIPWPYSNSIFNSNLHAFHLLQFPLVAIWTLKQMSNHINYQTAYRLAVQHSFSFL